jgi:hypothetical protein
MGGGPRVFSPFLKDVREKRLRPSQAFINSTAAVKAASDNFKERVK